ncbi:calcium-binding mitochondrial carrier protein SCaMC-2-like [Liolophura sinensis]|uniref:calcium-binding mitochondrial carrier protein SCaMC-2-like n=1 Tax=Liolophura sinensis TaxID=3198878 RepID=UPI0031591E96
MAATEVNKKYRELFDSLDVDKDGTVSMDELINALKLKGMKSSRAYIEAQKLFNRTDVDGNDSLDFSEFLTFMLEHEKELQKAFQNLDKNKDGQLDLDEIMQAFTELGFEMEPEEVKDLMKKLDKDGNNTIDWHEWRDFLLLNSGASIRDIMDYWRHESAIFDFGTDAVIPDDFTEHEMKQGLWWRHLVAGGIAGAISRTATHPLERLKVFMQVQTSNEMGVLGCIRYMVKEGGIRSLWRGNGILVLKLGPDTAIRFMMYEQLKKIVKGDSNRELSVFERFCTGASAGAIAQTAVYPTEVLKTRLCLRKTGQYGGIIDCTRQILRTEGVRSFTRGYVPTVLSIIPNAGLDLAVYETMKNWYLTTYNTQAPGVGVLLGCGTVSCVIGQVASYPLQLIRTRLQASGT